MASAYGEVILGVALGGTAGVVPAVAAAIAGGVQPSLSERRFIRGILAIISLPVAAVVAIAIGVLAWHPEQAPRMVAGGSVVPLVTVYGFEQGTRVGSVMHSDRGGGLERGRSLAGVAVGGIDAAGQVTIRSHGAIRTVPGYPDLPGELERSISAAQWRLPADLPLSELESRIERQLRLAYDLEVADVTVDPRGKATVAVATPASGIARQVPAGHRAVSISTPVPAEIESGEEIIIATSDHMIEGTVISSRPRSDPSLYLDKSEPVRMRSVEHNRQGRESLLKEVDRRSRRVRLTVAVPTDQVDVLLGEDVVTVAVRSRDTRPEFRALSLFDRSGLSVQMTRIENEMLDEVENTETAADVFAARSPSEDTPENWTFDPSIDRLGEGWQAVLIGEKNTLGELVPQSSAGAGVVES